MSVLATDEDLETMPVASADARSRPKAAGGKAHFQTAIVLAVGTYFIASLWLLIVLVIQAEHRDGVENFRGEVIGIVATVALASLVTLLVAEICRGRHVQHQLRSSEARLRDFAETASDWFWEQDADLRFTSITTETPLLSPNDQSHIGRRRSELNDTSLAPDHWTNHESDLLARRPFRDFRYSRIGPDGKVHHVSINGNPIYDEAGEFAGYRGTGRDVTAAVESEAELRDAKNRAEQAETLLSDAVDSMSEGFVIYDREDRFVMCNEPYRRTFAKGADLLVQGMRFEDILRIAVARGGNASSSVNEADWIAERLRAHQDGAGAVEQCLYDGSWILATDRRMKNGGIAGLRIDITARKLIEQQLSQAQRMEAIGNLAGGMAHDFNNGLGVIIGNLDVLGSLVEQVPTVVEICHEARDAALRCADMTRGLLAFARRQPLRPERTDVNALISDTAGLLGRTLGKGVAIKLQLDPALWPAIADPTHLETVLVNLAMNARDAMPKGGHVDIRTRNVELDATYATLQPEVRPGMFVAIEISDTGSGIPGEIISRIFEPFFTTKGPGEGSGLGLAMAFGFVKQSGGHMSVYSEPGLGSTFRLYLPRGDTQKAVRPRLSNAPVVTGGVETVLAVEDNPRLRRITVRQLSELGYQVLQAEHAEAALTILASGQKVDALFTDVVMPGGMDGLDLAREATRRRPDLKVLMASGFPGGPGGGDRLSDCPFPLLNKPYRRDELARAMRQVLDGTSEPPMADAVPGRVSEQEQV